MKIEKYDDLYTINSQVVSTDRVNRDAIKKHSGKLPGKFEYKPRYNQYKLRYIQYKPRDNNYYTRNNFKQSRDKWYKDASR